MIVIEKPSERDREPQRGRKRAPCFTAQNPYFRRLHGNPRFQRIPQAIRLDERPGATEP